MIDLLPTNCEISFYSPMYGDDDDQSREWRVWQVTGSINDREWTLVGSGPTLTQAINNALAALGVTFCEDTASGGGTFASTLLISDGANS